MDTFLLGASLQDVWIWLEKRHCQIRKTYCSYTESNVFQLRWLITGTILIHGGNFLTWMKRKKKRQNGKLVSVTVLQTATQFWSCVVTEISAVRWTLPCSRDERRWIEKQNRASRAQRKKEEMNRIRTLVGTVSEQAHTVRWMRPLKNIEESLQTVPEISAEHEVYCLISTDTAYSCDPRIKKFKEEEKARKESEKKAKADAKKREQEEKERVSVIHQLCHPFSLLLTDWCWTYFGRMKWWLSGKTCFFAGELL